MILSVITKNLINSETNDMDINMFDKYRRKVDSTILPGADLDAHRTPVGLKPGMVSVSLRPTLRNAWDSIVEKEYRSYLLIGAGKWTRQFYREQNWTHIVRP